jgi:mono/diheme cytochrome c family protein
VKEIAMTRMIEIWIAGAVMVGFAAGARVAIAKPVTYRLPAETSRLKKAPLEGYLLAEGECGTCHSRDYISTQPLGKGKEFWTAEVTKMVKVYGAMIPAPDQAKIADYLTVTY